MIYFVILNRYADWESCYVSQALAELTDQYEVRTVSHSFDKVKAIGGFHTIPDDTFDTVKDTFDGLILVGGYSWRENVADLALPLIKRALELNVSIGAICAASEFLAKQGFLNDIRHTSNGLHQILNVQGSLYTNQENYVNEQAVCDKKLTTANGSGTLEFAREFLLSLGTIDQNKILEWYSFHKVGLIEFMKRYQQ